MRRSSSENNRYFIVDKRALKTLLIHANYMIDQANRTDKMNQLLNKELLVSDSVNQILEAKIATEQERRRNFSSAYDEMRLSAASYDKQMRSLIDELASVKKIHRKDRRRSFVKGMALGIVSATFLGVVIIATH